MTPNHPTSMKHPLSLAALLACCAVAAGCGTGAPAKQPVDLKLHQAMLGTTLASLEPAKGALYSASEDTLIFEQARHELPVSWTPEIEARSATQHLAFDQHLDVWDVRHRRLALVPGTHLSGGEAYDMGRFADQSAFDADGALLADAWDLWVDYVACPCDGTTPTASCEHAFRVEIDVTASSQQGWVQLQVQGFRDQETLPFAVSRFTVPAEPDTTVAVQSATPGVF